MNTSSDTTATDSVLDQIDDTAQIETRPRVGLPGGPKTTLEECFYKVWRREMSLTVSLSMIEKLFWVYKIPSIFLVTVQCSETVS